MSMPECEPFSMPEYEPLPKKPRIEVESLTSHLEEAAVVRGLKVVIRCLRTPKVCKQLSDKLYRSLLDGVVTLAYLLFDKEELYEIGSSCMLDDQQNKFWDELAPFAKEGDSVYEVCKWIVSTNIDRDRYSLLNESNVATMLMTYKSCSYKKPFVGHLEGSKIKTSPIDDDIEEAIKKAKDYPRLMVEGYTLLLLEIYRDDLSEKWQEFLLAKAVERIDVKALYGLEADAILDLVRLNIHSSAHENLDWLIKFDLMELFTRKKYVVTGNLRASVVYSLLLIDAVMENEFDDVDRTSPPFFPVTELITIAELRRKAEGSRFISREHFVWAFEERGWGLRSAFKDELALRMSAEDHPPYHIYDIVLRLARAERVLPDVDHLAFAVVFDKFGLSVEVKELQEHFNRFKTAFRCCVSKPKDRSMVSDAAGGGGGAAAAAGAGAAAAAAAGAGATAAAAAAGGDAGGGGGGDEWYHRDASIKDFKERLEGHGGPRWEPIRVLNFYLK